MFELITRIAKIALKKFPVLAKKHGTVSVLWDKRGHCLFPVKIVEK